jgi:hypothetical protein
MCILKGFAGFFLVVGLLTLTAGVFFWLRTQKLVKHGLTAPGVVIENVVEERVDYDRDDHTRTTSRTYRPKVRFRSQNGDEVVFESRVGFGRPAYQQGEAVEVLYDPANPHGAEIKSFWSLWLGPMVAGCIGLVSLLVGVGIWGWLSRVRAPTIGGASPSGADRPIQ